MKRFSPRRPFPRPAGSIANVAARARACTLAATLAVASAAALAQGDSYVGRPVYSEPGSGIQLPPNCAMEPTWRSRIGTSDIEVWVVDCAGTPHTWLLKRSLIEMVANNQARLRFQILDDRAWPGETAGDSLSVQCTGRKEGETGFVVLGARWKPAGQELRLTGAQSVIRADTAKQKFVAATLAEVECVRYPQREAMMRKLNRANGR